MRRHRWIPAVIVATALVLASCGSDDDEGAEAPATAAAGPAAPAEEPPAEEPPEDEPPAEEPAAEEPPAEEPPEDEPPAEEPAEPDVVTKGTFDFASGADPQVRVTVAVGTSPDGGWEAAGVGANPTIDADQYWIQFTISNRDGLGTISEFQISGTDGTLGSGLCNDVVPIAPSGETTCVHGPLPVEPGPQTVPFTMTASGELQTDGQGQFIVPPLEPPGYQGAPRSFLFLFDTGVAPSGATLVTGSASGETVNIDIAGELTGTVSLSCASPGDGAGVTVLAFSITVYDDAGNPTDQCRAITLVTLDFTLEGLSDVAVNYTGT